MFKWYRLYFISFVQFYSMTMFKLPYINVSISVYLLVLDRVPLSSLVWLLTHDPPPTQCPLMLELYMWLVFVVVVVLVFPLERGSCYVTKVSLELPGLSNPPTSASWVAGIVDIHYCAWPVQWFLILEKWTRCKRSKVESGTVSKSEKLGKRENII